MSSTSLAEILPPRPNAFPDASGLMPSDVRERSRPIVDRLLSAMVDVALLPEPPSGSCRLRQNVALCDGRFTTFLNPGQRWAVDLHVVNINHVPAYVSGAVVHYDGHNEPTIQSNRRGRELVDHRGAYRSASVVGFVNGRVNLLFGQEGFDVEPSLTCFALHTGWHPSSILDGPEHHHHIVDYVPDNQPPRGGERIVVIAEQLAGFLENFVGSV